MRLVSLGRTTVAALALVALATAMTIAPAQGKSAQLREQDRRPNIVVVMTDDQTLADMKVLRQTRRLIGDRGVTFTNTMVSYPLCCPSRSSYMSGQYMHNHGVTTNFPPEGGYDRFDFSNALGVWLQKAGYYTAHVGKQLNFYGLSAKSNPTTVPPGYDDWYVPVDPFTYSFYRYLINHNGSLSFFGSAPADYQTDVLARHAEQVIRQRAGNEPAVAIDAQNPDVLVAGGIDFIDHQDCPQTIATQEATRSTSAD